MRRVKKGTRGDGPKNKASSKRMMSSGVNSPASKKTTGTKTGSAITKAGNKKQPMKKLNSLMKKEQKKNPLGQFGPKEGRGRYKSIKKKAAKGKK